MSLWLVRTWTSGNVIGCLCFRQVQGTWSSKWTGYASIAKCRLMQVTEQLGSASGRPIQFFGCHERLSSGDWLTAVSALRKKYDTPASAVRLRHSAVWNMAEMTLRINLYELIMPFEHCVLETEWMETQGNSLRFWNRKCIKWVKKLFHCQICYFLGRKFPDA
jgi:hypothetical protein